MSDRLQALYELSYPELTARFVALMEGIEAQVNGELS